MEKKLSSLLQYQYWGKHCSAAGGVFHQDTECFRLSGRWCWLQCRCSDAYLLKVLIFCPPFQITRQMSLFYMTFFICGANTGFLAQDCTCTYLFKLRMNMYNYHCLAMCLFSYICILLLCSVCIFRYRKRENAVSLHDTCYYNTLYLPLNRHVLRLQSYVRVSNMWHSWN